MTDTTELRTMFGAHALQPEGLRAVYGGRWIVTQDGYVDIVWDRHGVEGESTVPLADWLDHGALDKARATVKRFLEQGTLNTRKAEPVIIFQDRQGAIVANTNASAGYLYVTGWLFADLPEGSKTRGLEKTLGLEA